MDRLSNAAARAAFAKRIRIGRWAAVPLATVLAASAAHSQTHLPSVERFTATTAAMTPADLNIRIDVREWSDEAGRAAVVAALEGEAEASEALGALPTLGYVWRSDSPVGSAVKYAYRTTTADGDRLTFVTDRRLDAYDFKPWRVGEEAPAAQPDYSVIELYLDGEGTGTGTFSLGAEVQLDEQAGLVSLAAGAPALLENAKQAPEPYWAQGS